ncbi:MAG: AAA family ATPase [Clostridiaceae bacterium]|nr:AAA family ATPase [Clostridiaceae bacterium]
MNIEKIYIDSFGKFERFELDLGSDFNVIYGNNEDGKSTLMAFVRMMFYGDTSRSRNNIREKLRELYRPWHSDRMGGSIRFCADGARYQLDRNFGKTNSSDKIKITNLDTGADIPLMRNQEPGQIFFDLGLEAFEKSVFIGQNGSLISGTGKDDEIMQRLLNLVTTGEENTSYKKVADKLDAARQKLQGKQKAKGLLPESHSKLAQLRTERDQALQNEQAKANAQFEIERMREQQLELSGKRDVFRSRLKLLAVDKEQQELEKAIKRRKELDQKTDELLKLKRELERPDIVLDDSFIVAAEQKINEYNQLINNLEETEVQQQEQQKKLEELQSAAIREIPEGRTETLRQLEKDIAQTERERNALSDEIDKLQELSNLEQEHAELTSSLETGKTALAEIKEATEFASEKYEKLKQERQDHLNAQKGLKNEIEEAQRLNRQAELELNNAQNKLKSVSDQFNLRISMAEQQLEKARQPQVYQEDIPACREIKKPLVAAGIAIALLSLILGIIVDPFLFLLIIAAAIILVFSVRKVPARTITRQSTDPRAVEQAEKQLQQEQFIFNQDKTSAEQELEAVHVKNQEAAAQEETLRKQAAELDEILAKAEQQLESADSDYDEKKAQLAKLQADFEALEKQIEGKKASIADKRGPIIEKRAADDFETDVLISENQKQLAELNQKYNQMAQSLATGLADFDVQTLEEIYQLEKLWNSHKLQLEAAAKSAGESAEKIAELKQKLTGKKQELLDFVSSYKTAESVDHVLVLLDELEHKIARINNLNAEIIGYQSSFKDTENKAIPELEAQLQQVSQLLNELKASSGPTASNETSELVEPGDTIEPGASSEPVDLNTLEQRISDLEVQINELGGRIAGSEGSIREKYRKLRNVSQIDNEIEQMEEKIEKISTDLDVLGIAAKAMEEAFEEVQRSFGPLVNTRTAAIFKELTQGKYSNVAVSRDFSITFENSSDRSLREWGYLSSGTIDQAYLALRLAITELVTNGKEALPLLLDDIFTLYDDTRAAEGMRFISEYHQNGDKAQQVLLFTCHSRIADMGAKLGANSIILARDVDYDDA